MKRTYLTLIVLMLVIGFAAVTTNLVINGTVNIGFNEDEFNVYFSYASIDYEEKQSIISTDKKTIAFETKKLTDAGNESVLTYDVTNESKQYNAKVKVTCDEGTELYSIENSLSEVLIEARSTKTGYIKVILNKVVTEEQDIKFECHLEVTAVSRSEEKTNEIPEMCHYLNESYPVGYEWEYNYTGKEETLTIPCNGTYKLEVWGAQGGGNSTQILTGGLGGYSVGNYLSTVNTTLFINVGGQGEAEVYQANHIFKGGYNGGGDGGSGATTTNQYGFGGGGATHIAKITGQLSTLETHKNDDAILIVAGGGGGSGSNIVAVGGSGGGYKGTDGKNPVSVNNDYTLFIGTGGTQDSGGIDKDNSAQASQAPKGTFGQGAKFFNPKVSTIEGGCYGAGGGGGYYGGGGSSRGHAGAGGGSGYIGNSSLTDKEMWCYQCEISNDEGTKTTSTENVSAEPISEYAKQGNGYAKITLVSLEN